MTASKLAPETAHVWEDGLTELLAGLDLFDGEDRATYRSRVQNASTYTTVSRLRELAAHFGRPAAGNCSRGEAQRAIADAWITRAQRAAVGRLGLTPTQHATLAWYAGRQAYVARGRVVEARDTATFGRLFVLGLLEWSPLASLVDGVDLRPVRVTERGLAWLDAAGTVSEWRGGRA